MTPLGLGIVALLTSSLAHMIKGSVGQNISAFAVGLSVGALTWGISTL